MRIRHSSHGRVAEIATRYTGIVVLNVCLLTSHSVAKAQAPTIARTLSCREASCYDPRRSGVAGVPANSPYLLGAQLGYKLTGDDDFADALIASGRVTYESMQFQQQSANLHLPIIGNFAKLGASEKPEDFAAKIDKLVTSAEGLNLGLYPYYEFPFKPADNQDPQAKPGSWLRSTAYGSAVWKVDQLRSHADTTAKVLFNTFRLSIGIAFDAYVFKDNGSRPLSVSIEPVYTIPGTSKTYREVFGTDKENITSLELTGILPLSEYALLAQASVAERRGPLVRVGLLLFNKE